MQDDDDVYPGDSIVIGGTDQPLRRAASDHLFGEAENEAGLPAQRGAKGAHVTRSELPEARRRRIFSTVMAHLGLIAAQFAFAGLYVLTKVTFDDSSGGSLSPQMFVFARLVQAVPVLWIAALLLDGRKGLSEVLTARRSSGRRAGRPRSIGSLQQGSIRNSRHLAAGGDNDYDNEEGSSDDDVYESTRLLDPAATGSLDDPDFMVHRSVEHGSGWCNTVSVLPDTHNAEAAKRLRRTPPAWACLTATVAPPKTVAAVLLVVWMAINVVTNQTFDAAGVKAGPDGPVIAGLVQPLAPVLISGIGVVTGREHFSIAKLGGVAFCLVGGVIMLKVWDLPPLDQPGNGQATVFLLIMTVGVALAVTFTNELMRRVQRPVAATAYFITGAFLLSIASAAASPGGIDISEVTNLSLPARLALVYAGIVPTSVSYIVISLAVSKVGVAVLSLYFLLQPVITALLALFLLNEKVEIFQIVGGALAGVGLLIASIAQFREADIEHDDSFAHSPLGRCFWRLRTLAVKG
jgi:drug/metabolite transporter (DMT)-like permease